MNCSELITYAALPANVKVDTVQLHLDLGEAEARFLLGSVFDLQVTECKEVVFCCALISLLPVMHLFCVEGYAKMSAEGMENSRFLSPTEVETAVNRYKSRLLELQSRLVKRKRVRWL